MKNSPSAADRSRCQVVILWANDRSKLSNNYYSPSPTQFPRTHADFKDKYSNIIQEDLSNLYIANNKNSESLKYGNNREWYLPSRPAFHLETKTCNVRGVLNGAAKFQNQSSNNALLTGHDLLKSLIILVLIQTKRARRLCRDRRNALPNTCFPDDRLSLLFLW